MEEMIFGKMGFGGDTPTPPTPPTPPIVDEDSDLLFIDFDGTPVYGMTKEQGLALTELPECPDHTEDEIPLTSEGWNYTLEEVKACLNDTGVATVGALYHTTDGYTHIKVKIPDADVSGVILYVIDNKYSTVVDWGDGSEEANYTSSNTHVYAEAGIYDIKVKNAYDVSMYSSGGGAADTYGQYCKPIQIRYSSDIKSIKSYCNYYCTDLMDVNIPSTVTSIGSYAFGYCTNMKGFVLPPNVSMSVQFAQDNYMLKHISLPCVINYSGSIQITDAFINCNNINDVRIPHGIEHLSGGFKYVYNLKRVVLPDTLLDINGSFSYCYNLTEVKIPESVTKIINDVFYKAYNITKICIPKNVTYISSNVCAYSYRLTVVKIEAETPPTVNASGIFSSKYKDNITKLIVPKGCLETYQSATNWSHLASKMVEAEE